MQLRPVRREDEHAVLALHRRPVWGPYDFLFAYDPERPWSDHVTRLADAQRGIGLREGEVAATFLLAWDGDTLVGRASIRHELNDYLEVYGGHIGYAVAPEHRRRGHATEILRQSLVIARDLGIADVLVTCDDDNVASARAIERCGGRLDSTVDGPGPGERRRRYWIC